MVENGNDPLDREEKVQSAIGPPSGKIVLALSGLPTFALRADVAIAIEEACWIKALFVDEFDFFGAGEAELEEGVGEFVGCGVFEGHDAEIGGDMEGQVVDRYHADHVPGDVGDVHAALAIGFSLDSSGQVCKGFPDIPALHTLRGCLSAPESVP